MVVLKPPMDMKKLRKEMGVCVAFLQEQDLLFRTAKCFFYY
jgi:hypothetical protein